VTPESRMIWPRSGPCAGFLFRCYSRAYKDGEEWKDVNSYGEDDVLPMGELFRDAYAWIRKQKQADAQARKKEAEPAAA
jgi:hypothetical protein